MLKGRFPWLRSIRLVITEDIKSLKRILQIIDATVILHNMLIEFGEEEPEDGIDFDDFSDIWMKLHVPRMTKTMSSMRQFLSGHQRALEEIKFCSISMYFFSKLVFFVHLQSVLNIVLLAVEDINNPFHLWKEACNPII
jgi:hypothetical protein